MIKIKRKTEGEALKLTVSGRLDTSTAAKLEAEVERIGEDVSDLIIDLKGLEYISSAGLRVLLSTQKQRSALRY